MSSQDDQAEDGNAGNCMLVDAFTQAGCVTLADITVVAQQYGCVCTSTASD